MRGRWYQNVQPKSPGEANGSEGKWMKAITKTMHLISRLISLLLLRKKALPFRGRLSTSVFQGLMDPIAAIVGEMWATCEKSPIATIRVGGVVLSCVREDTTTAERGHGDIPAWDGEGMGEWECTLAGGPEQMLWTPLHLEEGTFFKATSLRTRLQNLPKIKTQPNIREHAPSHPHCYANKH